jgi:hypothetical protein
MIWLRRTFLAIPAAVSIASVSIEPSPAEPRLLGIGDLSEDQQKLLWDRVDHVASYVVTLKVCAGEADFEKRFVEAVRPCIEPDTVTRVVGYYERKAVDLQKRASRSTCTGKEYVANNWTQKIKSTLDNLVYLGHSLCLGYLRTGVVTR